MNKLLLAFGLCLSLTFFSCQKDDDTPANTSGSFKVSIENVSTPKDFFESGVFNVPVGKSDPAPLFSGDAYEFTVNAGPNVLPGDGGTRLSFITMFVQSNDLFFAPGEEGIALYDDQGNPIGEGTPLDVTDQVDLWDSGTEVNEATGGPNQKPQQAPTAEDMGVDENGVVTLLDNNMDAFGNILPNNEDVIKVTIAYLGDASFKVRMENVSNANTIAVQEGNAAVPLSPGAYVVHTQESPLFETGVAAGTGGVVNSAEGVEDLAEDGVASTLVEALAAQTGLIVPLSPGVFAVHSGGNPIYTTGQPDYGDGLEAEAEDGIPTGLAEALASNSDVSSSGVFNIPIGSTGPGAIGPGGSYEFEFEAATGDYLSLVTMFVQSNDWFYTFDPQGLALFNGDIAVSGDVTASIGLYDAGTEIDEVPGAGLNQVIRQGAANTGPIDDDNTVRGVTTSEIPAVSEVIRVVITPQ